MTRRSTRTSLALLAFLSVFSVTSAGADEPLIVLGGGDVRLAVYETGNPSGKPLVFIHGFTQNYLSWSSQFTGPLAEQFRLVALDMRGHGASDKPLDAESYTTSAYWAEDIAAIISELELEDPILVGWSYGGLVISDYLRAFGDEGIGGLVFVGAVTNAGSEEAMAMLGDEALAVFGDVLSNDTRTRIDGTRAFLRLLTGEPIADDLFEVGLASAMMVPPEIRSAMFNRELDNDDVLVRTNLPALIVHGDTDHLVRVSSAEHIARLLANSNLLVYEGIGHAPFLEDSNRFNRDLAQFVGSLQAR